MIESGTTKCTILWDGAEIGTCTSTDAAIIAGFPMPEASPGWHTVTLRETFELVPRPVIIRFQAQSQAQSLLVPVKWERSADIMTQTEVPAVVGGRLSAALNDIADAQLTEGITETSEFEDGDDPSEWEVVQQDPEAGEYLDPGSAVILSVRPVTVPPTEPEPPLPPPVNQPGDGTPGTTEPRAGDGGATKSSASVATVQAQFSTEA